MQALRKDEAASGKFTRARRPRAVVLCPTRELAEQVSFSLLCAAVFFRVFWRDSCSKFECISDIVYLGSRGTWHPTKVRQKSTLKLLKL